MDEQDLLRKISGLLAKAEGTDNEFEATAFFEKAQEMMVEYAIDEARVRAAQRAGNRPVESPVKEDFMFSSYDHHAVAKTDLLGYIARAHSVRSIPYSNRKDSNMFREGNRGLHESQWTRLVGYKQDIINVKMLYVSLLIQSQKFAAEDWRVRYGTEKYTEYPDRIGKFTWLSSHMEGFAERINRRFRELSERIYESAPDSKALILNKDAEIDDFLRGGRPAPEPVSYCYALQPVEQLKRKNMRQAYCIKRKGHELEPPEGEGTPHDYTYKPTYSSYVAKGRRESYEGRQAGGQAADRADIGLTRTGAGRQGQLR